jgi:hypothetical protein
VITRTVAIPNASLIIKRPIWHIPRLSMTWPVGIRT